MEEISPVLRMPESQEDQLVLTCGMPRGKIVNTRQECPLYPEEALYIINIPNPVVTNHGICPP